MGRSKITVEQFKALYALLGGIGPVARKIGMDERGLRRWIHRKQEAHELPEDLFALKQARTILAPKKAEEATTVCAQDLTKYLTKPRTVNELADLTGATPRRIKELLDVLTEAGYNLTPVGADKWRIGDYIPMAETKVSHLVHGNRVKFALVSDNHFGSKQQQETHLNNFYDRCVDQEIDTVYNFGDVLAGTDVYKGQHAEIFLHTEDDQVGYATEYYPKRKGIITKVIGGNHDLSFVKKGGADPIKMIADQRKDIEYLGPWSAWVSLRPATDPEQATEMYMLHPDGGPAYALSYKLQKLIESFQGGQKPALLGVGHWHNFCHVLTRNVHGLLVPCFEAQTSHERRHALHPVIGGLIVEIEFAEDRWEPKTFKWELIHYPSMRERDWK